MSVNLATQPAGQIVPKEQIVDLFGEILSDLNAEKQDMDEVFTSFHDMVMNQGDASTSSKEALMRSLELRSGIADKKTKLLDLMLKAHLKEGAGGPKTVNVNQHGDFHFDKRKMLEAMEAADAHVKIESPRERTTHE